MQESTHNVVQNVRRIPAGAGVSCVAAKVVATRVTYKLVLALFQDKKMHSSTSKKRKCSLAGIKFNHASGVTCRSNKPKAQIKVPM